MLFKLLSKVLVKKTPLKPHYILQTYFNTLPNARVDILKECCLLAKIDGNSYRQNSLAQWLSYATIFFFMGESVYKRGSFISKLRVKGVRLIEEAKLKIGMSIKPNSLMKLEKLFTLQLKQPSKLRSKGKITTLKFARRYQCSSQSPLTNPHLVPKSTFLNH